MGADEVADVIVVGAGLAGLACALDLVASGLTVRVLERAAQPGGRVATDVVDGFTLDRGFQVLNTSYPQVRRRVDLEALDVAELTPGALVAHSGSLRRVGNPLRRPSAALSTLRDGLLPLPAVARLGAYSARAGFSPPSRLRREPDVDAMTAFAAAGLDASVVDRLLRPFLSGVLLEADLATSRRYVDLVWRSFVRGRSVLPRAGMAALPAQLAGALPDGTIEYGCPVGRVDAGEVTAGGGETLTARAVVVAADPVTAAAWLALPKPEMRSVRTYYFCSADLPLAEPTLVLDGDARGPVINTVVLTEAVPGYAPAGQNLVSASVLDSSVSEADVRTHLNSLYGRSTAKWETVARVAVPDALPAFLPGSQLSRPPAVNGVFVAGDHRATPSIQGAMASGTATARAVVGALA